MVNLTKKKKVSKKFSKKQNVKRRYKSLKHRGGSISRYTSPINKTSFYESERPMINNNSLSFQYETVYPNIERSNIYNTAHPGYTRYSSPSSPSSPPSSYINIASKQFVPNKYLNISPTSPGNFKNLVKKVVAIQQFPKPKNFKSFTEAYEGLSKTGILPANSFIRSVNNPQPIKPNTKLIN
jgi:hypothetical protein